MTDNNSRNGSLLVIPQFFSPFTDNQQKRPSWPLCYLLVAATAFYLFFTSCPPGAGQGPVSWATKLGALERAGSGPWVGGVGTDTGLPGKAGLSG